MVSSKRPVACGAACHWCVLVPRLQVELCKQLFGLVAKPDLITYETMINAFGYSGQPRGAEHVFAAMQQVGQGWGFLPRHTEKQGTCRAAVMKQIVLSRVG